MGSTTGTWISLAAPLFLVILFKTFIDSLRTKRKNGPYPPGPPRKPIIGNLLDLQFQKDLGPEYVEWGKKYNSDILFASALGNHVLILNKQCDADELFERRANIYSDRPQIRMTKLLGWEGMVSLLPYGNYWRMCRKICQQHFNYEAAKQYRPIIQEKVHKMLAGLLVSPENLQLHNKMLSVSITMAAMYGYEVKSIDDKMIHIADQTLAMGAGLLTPNSSLINLLPFLACVPPWLAGPLKSRKTAEETRKMSVFLISEMYDFVKKAVENGTAVPSLVTNFVEKYKGSKAPEDMKNAINDVAFTTYSGAADTTISVTSTFFYLMATHPEVQQRAKAELDKLLGSERLPTFEDRPSLPYIEAIYREVMRYQQSLHLAAPHALTEDDYYKGHFIPKGTMVFGNIWAMTHDEEVYPDSYSFKPERFLDENGKLNKNDRIMAYGFGRRVCVGKAVASSIVWFMMASVLTCFDIGKAKDHSGNEIEVNAEYYTEGLITHKKEYKCSIVPRAPAYRELIAERNSNS